MADSPSRTTSTVPDVEWEIEVTRNGVWPAIWRWKVGRHQRNPYDYDVRFGETFSKDRARRKALKAKRSMEEDDVKVVYR